MRIIFVLWLCSSTLAMSQMKTTQLASGSTVGTSILINHKSPENIVALVGDAIHYSLDGGGQWLKALDATNLTSPTLQVDNKGTFYIFYSTRSGLALRKSTDKGKSWDDESMVNEDSASVIIRSAFAAHPRKEMIVASWIQRPRAVTDSCSSNIMLTSSSSGGKKWGKQITINKNPGTCDGSRTSINGTNTVVTRDGKVFMVWCAEERIFMDRSYDGNMWIQTDLPVWDQPGGWQATISGFTSANAIPSLSADNTEFRTQGTIYLCFAGPMTKGAKDMDILLIRSANFGDYWIVPTKVNLDNSGRQQFMPKVAVDQTSGFVYVIYYDRRDHENDDTDVYLAYSVDAGTTFAEKKISEKPFRADMSKSRVNGEYLSICAHKGFIVATWTRTDDQQPSTWLTVIKHDELAASQP